MAQTARILFWLALVFALTMAWLPQPPELGDGLGDKWHHMAAFTALTILAVMAFPATPLLRLGERLSFVGAMIEVVQSIPVLHRDCDIMDWIADTAVVIGVLAVVIAYRRREAAAGTPSRQR